MLYAPKTSDIAAFYTPLWLVGPLHLHYNQVALSHGLLCIIASKMCSVTKDMTKASVSIGMSLLKAVLMGSLACML